MGRPRTAGADRQSLHDVFFYRIQTIAYFARLLQFTKKHDAVCIGELRALTQVAVYRKQPMRY